MSARCKIIAKMGLATQCNGNKEGDNHFNMIQSCVDSRIGDPVLDNIINKNKISESREEKGRNSNEVQNDVELKNVVISNIQKDDSIQDAEREETSINMIESRLNDSDLDVDFDGEGKTLNEASLSNSRNEENYEKQRIENDKELESPVYTSSLEELTNNQDSGKENKDSSIMESPQERSPRNRELRSRRKHQKYQKEAAKDQERKNAK